MDTCAIGFDHTAEPEWEAEFAWLCFAGRADTADPDLNSGSVFWFSGPDKPLIPCLQ
jgi:hypothetical protein